MRNDRLAIFPHVEKCGGTSVIAASRRRRALRHCDLVPSDRMANRASARDFGAALRAYRRLDFVSGHCIAPASLAEFRQMAIDAGYAHVVTVTVLRPPIERLLSDYVHDVTRRSSHLSLSDFIQIGWKQNYYIRFFGDGEPAEARRALDALDIVDVSGGDRLRSELPRAGFAFAARDATRSNVFEATPPPDLCVEDGVAVGKYRVAPSDYEEMVRLNSDDITLFSNISRSGDMAHEEATGLMPTISERESRPMSQRLYRNLVYKPLFARRAGMTLLPRNAAPAEQVRFAGQSIWSPAPPRDPS